MGKAIMTNVELIESIIVDLNTLCKEAANGQYINACMCVTQMSQKLLNLRKTVDDDLKNREQTIESLKESLRNAGHIVEDVTPQEFIDKMKGGGE